MVTIVEVIVATGTDVQITLVVVATEVLVAVRVTVGLKKGSMVGVIKQVHPAEISPALYRASIEGIGRFPRGLMSRLSGCGR